MSPGNEAQRNAGQPSQAGARRARANCRPCDLPRVVVAGTGSGVGKTTVACGLIAALCARGERVQGFKVGPDYIDPSYHTLAAGRPGRNLDAFLAGAELIAPLFAHGMRGASLAVVEGVMGMFDGASGRGELASTAHVAKLLRAPVLLVVDAAATARSVAAIVHGFRTFDPQVKFAGVIFNRVGSEHHAQLLREAVEPLGVAVIGALPRDPRLATPERHLGLIPAGERAAAARRTLRELGEALAHHLDLELVTRIARAAPPLSCTPWDPQAALGAAARAPRGADATIAVAAGPAFSFHYRENLELLEAAGAELAPFDPTRGDTLPPDSSGLLLAGGFPERYAEELAANAPLRAEIATLCAQGAPVLAECGGLLYLCESLDGRPMCGVLPARARMSERLTLGYREATALTATPWLAAGQKVRGHEFHYSRVEPASGDVVGEREGRGREVRARDSREREGRGSSLGAAWLLRSRGRERAEGFVAGGVQASYLHTHWAAYPELAAGFARAAAAARVATAPSARDATTSSARQEAAASAPTRRTPVAR